VAKFDPLSAWSAALEENQVHCIAHPNSLSFCRPNPLKKAEESASKDAPAFSPGATYTPVIG